MAGRWVSGWGSSADSTDSVRWRGVLRDEIDQLPRCARGWREARIGSSSGNSCGQGWLLSAARHACARPRRGVSRVIRLLSCWLGEVRVSVTAIDLQVDNVPVATKLLSDAYGWEVLSDGQDFGELMAGQTGVMLSVEAMVPLGEGRRHYSSRLRRRRLSGGGSRGRRRCRTDRRAR